MMDCTGQAGGLERSAEWVMVDCSNATRRLESSAEWALVDCGNATGGQLPNRGVRSRGSPAPQARPRRWCTLCRPSPTALLRRCCDAPRCRVSLFEETEFTHPARCPPLRNPCHLRTCTAARSSSCSSWRGGTRPLTACCTAFSKFFSLACEDGTNQSINKLTVVITRLTVVITRLTVVITRLVNH